MKSRIETLEEKKLVGKSLKMSVSNNKTRALWSSFSPKIKEIKNKLSNHKISMQVYDVSYFDKFNINNQFEKWATVEVTSFINIPKDMECFILKGGLYAVFDYKGLSTDTSIFQYIFNVWLPNSEYLLDIRPHFEVLGDNYKNNCATSEEEIWIPVKKK